MVPGLIAGSILGALVVNILSGEILQVVFGVFLCVMGIFFFRKRLPQMDGHRVPKFFFLSLISMGIGGISNILGIGGGTLSVPTLNAFRISQKKSIGTSSAISFLITFIGAIFYLMLGFEEPSAPDNIGFINLPAFFIVGTVSFFAARYIARFAHQISDHVLKQIFGFVLILTGISIIIH